jgi:DNA (cytosine-5)-methyltransferase 1
MEMLSFFEFFAGGGMAHLGLGKNWVCKFANDNSRLKEAAYRCNFPNTTFSNKDVCDIRARELPGTPDLIWGSFPCQDLSLAGKGAGLSGERSGVFWPFWRLIQQLAQEGRKPTVVVLENVVGMVTSKAGEDFNALISIVARNGYKVGAVVADASHFVPQSRPRLFIVAVNEEIEIPGLLLRKTPDKFWHPARLQGAAANFPLDVARQWVWWRLPHPPKRKKTLASIVEVGDSVQWDRPEKTARLLGMMSRINRQKVNEAKRAGDVVYGCIFKRTRLENGQRNQRAEVRFDGISGCLRTAGGGSSKQILLEVRSTGVRSRHFSKREAARLMGISDSYVLPAKENDALHLVGDGLAVPVVRALERSLLRPLAEARLANFDFADLEAETEMAESFAYA